MKTQLLNYPKQKDLIQEKISTLLGFNFTPLAKDPKEHKFLSFPDYFDKDEKLKIVIEGQAGKLSLREICLKYNITRDLFYQWTREFLIEEDFEEDKSITESDDDKFRVVLEALNGEFSVAEICRRDNISHDTFLDWSRSFLLERRRSLAPSFIKNNVDVETNPLLGRISGEVLTFLESYIDFYSDNLFVSNDPEMSVIKMGSNNYDKLICLYKMNDLRHINKHFEALNEKMNIGDVLVGCMETFTARKERIWVNKIPVVNNLYFGCEFVLKRIIPKIESINSLYFNLTKGKDRLLSKAEALGRLVSCGFKIMDHKSIDGLVYFVIQKEKQPDYNMHPSFGPLFAMPRLGKNGNIIRVYKLRTMHPYSEYLQDYIIRANGYAESGKPADDFRIPIWGKIMRKFWLDELPQLYNFIKGDLKLVGIRPVSERYFQDIPTEMQKLRLTQKPGCIPPYVSLNRSGSVMSVLQAEKEYLEEKIRNPWFTDTKYFFKALYNVVVRRKRSA